MIEVLLLEIEGVLVDTRDLRREALREALASDGIAASDDRLALADGRAPRTAVRTVLAASGIQRDPTASDLLGLMTERAFSARLARGPMLVPGAAEALRSLQGEARLAVVTRARRSDAELVVNLAELEPTFEAIIADDDVVDAKPAPDAYLVALARLARRRPFALDRCVALEDGASGVRAARAAGLRCLAVGPIEPQFAIEADGYASSLASESLASLDALTTRTAERSGEA